MPSGRKAFRAKDEIRTRDPDLGKVVLYQLSYFRKLIHCVVFLWGCKYRNINITIKNNFIFFALKGGLRDFLCRNNKK